MTSDDFLKEYGEEVKEHLQELEHSLLALEREGTDKEKIQRIFRAAHSIKGASAYMGFEKLAHLTHEMETLFSEIRARSLPLSGKGISILLECVDFISNALGHLQEKGEEPALPSSLLESLRTVLVSQEEDDSPSSPHEEEQEDLAFLFPDEEHTTVPGGPEESESVIPKIDGDSEEPEGEMEPEEDQELLEIFVSSFLENSSELVRLLSSSGEVLTDSDFNQTQELVKRLIASSQYMDYERMVTLLKELEQDFLVSFQTGTTQRDFYAHLFDRYIERMQKLMPALRPAPSTSMSEEKPREAADQVQEEDEELLHIFLDTFQQQHSELLELVPRQTEYILSEDDLETALGLIKRLISSSQYMDYNPVVNVLKEWEESLAESHAKEPVSGEHYAELLWTFAERLNLVMPELALQSSVVEFHEEPKMEILLQEEDEELLGIFLNTFHEQFAQLGDLIPGSPDGALSRADLEAADDLVKRLISSSQYMDYEQVVNALRTFDEGLQPACEAGAINGIDYAKLLNDCAQELQQLMPALQLPPIFTYPEERRLWETPGQALGASTGTLTMPSQGPEAAQGTAVHHIEIPGEIPETEMPVQPFKKRRSAQRKAPASTGPEEASSSVTLRVDAQKVDQLLNQVGELVVTRSEFVQTVESLRGTLRDLEAQGKLSKQELRALRSISSRLSESTVSLGRVAGHLQDSVMRIRMLPVAQLFQRFPRIVRDQGLKLNKNVKLILEGGETEIDKRVLEQMNDPLVQFLRNAIVHGIESPEERMLAGKPETGSIRLAAYHEGDHVVLEIEDDGRGIDTQKLRQILESSGTIASSDLEKLSDQELVNTIFLPGISTHDSVDGSAGRGVGLDVVKENVERMNGTIEVESHPGLGTRFVVRIPLTVAIIRALLVSGAEQVFTLPLTTVSEILRFDDGMTHTMEGFQVISLRGKTIPIVHLTQLVNVPSSRSLNDHRFIVIVTTSFREVGMVVDGLLGEQEVVIKSIEDDFNIVEGFSGATVLGDGSISLILDVSTLLKRMQANLHGQHMPYGAILH